MSQPLFFRIYKDGQLLEVKQIQGSQVVFGSNSDLEISLSDDSVAPIHAMVEVRESGYFVCDLGSGGGTLLNGAPVLDTEIQSGDQIQIGEFVVEFYVGVPKPKSKPPKVGAQVAPPPTVEKEVGYDAPAAPTPVKETPKPIPQPVQPKAPPVPKVQPVAPAPVQPKPQPVVAAAPVAKSTWKKTEPVAAQPVSRGGLEKHSKSPKTFAPLSPIKDLNDVVKPSKGTVVEIVVAWKERVLTTCHFDQRKTITVGSHPKNDIILPVFGSSQISQPLVKLEGSAKIFLTSEQKGELTHSTGRTSLSQLGGMGRLETVGAARVVTLQQGELIRVDFGDSVAVFVRYVAQAPKPLAGPLLGLSSGEVTSAIASAVFMLFIALYFAVYAPTPVLEEIKDLEPQRIAKFEYKPKVDATQINPVESEPPKNAKLADKKTEAVQKSPIKAPPQKAQTTADEGKAAEAKQNKSKSTDVKLTTPNPGKNTGIKKGSSAANNKNDAQGSSANKDVTKMGMLSVLSGKGAQDSLSKAYSGAGAVGGLAQNATGSGSQSAVGAGDTPGDGLKDIGKGGTGEATVGIAGVGTKGRGTGMQGIGTGGIGDKKGATVIPGGAEEAFEGTIDRDAIRRVIQENKRQIQACYEKGLNRDPGLHGKIVLKWTIGDRGVVKAAKVENTTMNSREVEQCIVSRLRTWRFPEPPAGSEAEVVYPFVFTAQN